MLLAGINNSQSTLTCFVWHYYTLYLQFLSHGFSLLLTALLHFLLNIGFVRHFGLVGFILANCVNSALRMLYNWRWYILPLFKSSGYRNFSLRALLPSVSMLTITVLAFIATSISYQVNFNAIPKLGRLGTFRTRQDKSRRVKS